MSRSTVPHRRRGPAAFPGMRTCRACGQPYTVHAMVCPRCHGYGPLNALAQAPERPAEPAFGEFVVDLCPPSVVAPKPSPAPEYPAWLTRLADEIGNTNEHLEHLLVWRNMSDELRALMRAVIHCRTKKSLPAAFDEPAVRALVAESSWKYVLEQS